MAAAEFEQSLVAEQSEGAQDGVCVDAHDGGEVAGWWEAFAGFGFAVGDRATDLCGDLVVEERRVVAVDLDIPHGAIHSSDHACATEDGVPVALITEQPLASGVDAGVIEDARQRQRLRRGRVISAVAVIALVGALGYVALGGGSAGGKHRFARPPAGGVANRLEALSRSAYSFFATPDLFPGDSGMHVVIQGSGGTGGNCCAVYPGANSPISIYGLSANERLIFADPHVAAVRIGDLGVLPARRTSALPAGYKIVAYRLPRDASSALQEARLSNVTPLNSRGKPLASAYLTHSASETVIPFPYGLGRTTTHGGSCATRTTLSGLTENVAYASTRIIAVPSTLPGLLLSCMDAKYTFAGAQYNVAILLNAHHPGQPPAALWGATSVPGHPGILDVAPPKALNVRSPLTQGRLLARRVGNAWLVEQSDAYSTVGPPPGRAPRALETRPSHPTLAQSARILTAIRITRTDIAHTN